MQPENGWLGNLKDNYITTQNSYVRYKLVLNLDIEPNANKIGGK